MMKPHTPVVIDKHGRAAVAVMAGAVENHMLLPTPWIEKSSGYPHIHNIEAISAEHFKKRSPLP